MGLSVPEEMFSSTIDLTNLILKINSNLQLATIIIHYKIIIILRRNENKTRLYNQKSLLKRFGQRGDHPEAILFYKQINKNLIYYKFQ